MNLFSHITWNLANNHFEDWSEIVKDYAHLKTRPITKYDDIFNIDSIFLFAKKENGLELYSRKSERKNSINLKCSNDKIRPDEISHLPMRLAMTNGDENDTMAAEQYLRELKILSTIK